MSGSKPVGDIGRCGLLMGAPGPDELGLSHALLRAVPPAQREVVDPLQGKALCFSQFGVVVFVLRPGPVEARALEDPPKLTNLHPSSSQRYC